MTAYVLKNKSRISLNNCVGTLYHTGDDHFTIVFDGEEPKSFEKHTIYNAMGNSRCHLVEDEEQSVPLNGTICDPNKLSEINRARAYIGDVRTLKYPKSRRFIKDSIAKTAFRIGDEGNEPSDSQILRMLYKLEKIGPKADPALLFVPREQKQRLSDSRTPDHFKLLMEEVIDDHFMKGNGRIIASYRFLVEIYKDKWGIDLGMSKKDTFYRRIREICPIELARRKYGNQKARELQRLALAEMRVNNILDQYQLDALHLSIGLKDDEGNFIGYPVVHFAIDVYSRAIVGFSVEIGSESSSGVVECLKSAFTPKNRLTDHPYTQNDWPSFGKPFEISSDGGSAYMADTVSAFIGALGVNRMANQARTPWHKGVVERFNNTCRMQFAEHMKGYLGKQEYGREFYGDLKKYAFHTLESFTEELTKYIVDDYNQAPHGHHLGRSPNAVWKEAAQLKPPIKPANLDLASRYKGKWIKSTYSQNKGLRVNNVYYNSPELNSLFWEVKKYTDDPIKFDVLYNSMDIFDVTVMTESALITVPFTTCDGNIQIRPEMPLAEYNAKRKARKEIAEQENEQINHVSYAVQQALNSGDNKSDIKNTPAPQKNKRPQAPMESVSKTISVMALANGTDKAIDQPVDNDDESTSPSDEIDSNPMATLLMMRKGVNSNDV